MVCWWEPSGVAEAKPAAPNVMVTAEVVSDAEWILLLGVVEP